MGRVGGVSSGGVASTTIATWQKGCTSTGVVRPDTGAIGKEVRRTGVVRPGYRDENGGEEVGLTELASKFCPLASCPCRWPKRYKVPC